MENTPTNHTIKSWAIEERPREKLMQRGKQSLTDAELLAILIGSGNNKESAVDLCRRILKDNDSDLLNLSKKSLVELMTYKGIGEAKAISIIAGLELGTRCRLAELRDKQHVASSKDAFDIFQPLLSGLHVEQFWIMLLNQKNKILSKECISMGGIGGTMVDVKFIFKKAVQSLASGIVLCHNHPSGYLRPSEADKQLTEQLVAAGKVLEINIIDHLIVSDHISNYYSFADEGHL